MLLLRLSAHSYCLHDVHAWLGRNGFTSYSKLGSEEVYIPEEYECMTALALAALNGRRDVCTFLIECYDLAPDEIDHVDSCGMAAFDHAVYGKNHDIAIYLFNHGANIALYDGHTEESPFNLALPDYPFCLFLILAGALCDYGGTGHVLYNKVSALAALMSAKDVEAILAHTRGVVNAAKVFFELIIISTARRRVHEAPECFLSSLSTGLLHLVSQYAGIETGRRLRNVAEFDAHLIKASSSNSPNK